MSALPNQNQINAIRAVLPYAAAILFFPSLPGVILQLHAAKHVRVGGFSVIGEKAGHDGAHHQARHNAGLSNLREGGGRRKEGGGGRRREEEEGGGRRKEEEVKVNNAALMRV